MTATALPPRSAVDRVRSAALIYRTQLLLAVGWPVGMLGTAFAINYVVSALVGAQIVSGGVTAGYGFALAFTITAMVGTFPFALGLGVTRRDFFVATLVVLGGQAVALATVIVLLGVVERATDGWGVQLVFFGIGSLLTGSLVLDWLANVAVLALLSAVGLVLGAVGGRWKTKGTVMLLAASIVLGGLLVIVVTWAKAWGDIGSFLVDTPRIVSLVLLPWAGAVAATAAAWLVARRTTL